MSERTIWRRNDLAVARPDARAARLCRRGFIERGEAERFICIAWIAARAQGAFSGNADYAQERLRVPQLALHGRASLRFSIPIWAVSLQTIPTVLSVGRVQYCRQPLPRTYLLRGHPSAPAQGFGCRIVLCIQVTTGDRHFPRSRAAVGCAQFPRSRRVVTGDDFFGHLSAR